MDIGAFIKDQYKVVEHIGRGGMADVWSAQDTRLRRIVAIKTIAKGLSADVDPVALFEREAQTIAHLEHPHILPIYDFGEYEGSLYIVMRFVTGGSLEKLLESGPMPPAEVLKMAEAIAHALDHAHQNNVIHLDLKPPNILLGSSQTPYLADFGLATVLDVEGRARNPGSGTLLYMAPEQLVAEVIDRRADIYSFCIMLFHMLTGQLPFEGTIPLALAQLQQGGREMPDVETVRPDLPYQISDLLRHGTATNPQDRPTSLSQVVDGMRAILLPNSGMIDMSSMSDTDAFLIAEIDLQTKNLTGKHDADLLEAVDIYTRARHQWAGGQGRFLLGVSHFMLISGYYQQTKKYNLEIDESGYELMLRGALEYDVDADYWWSKLNDDSRREVCLHTLRSMNTPARIRALYRLETLSDDANNAQIPRLVSQALEIETDETARIAALRVLGTRARLMKPRQQFKVMTEFQGRLLTSMTRFGIQLLPPSVWQESVYTPEIDLLIAEAALDTDSDKVAEFAARTVGQMRSLTAVRHIANEQRTGTPGALQALALVRDEAPALPDVVSRQGRWYAWLTNTARRLTDRPLDGILRFVLALLGGWIGMGELVYTTFRSQELFTAQRWGNSIAIGLVFGLFVAFTVLITDEFSRRLERFWAWWLRLLVFGLLGYGLGALTWSAFTWLYLQYIPQADVMRVAGFALMFGFVISAMLRLPGWQAVLLTAFVGFLPIFALYRNFYFTAYDAITPVVPIALIGGVWLGWRAKQYAGTEPQLGLPIPAYGAIVLAVGFGLTWIAIWWSAFARLYQSLALGFAPTWDNVVGMIGINLLLGTGVGYFFKGKRPFAFAISALVAFIAFDLSAGWYFYDLPFMPGLAERAASYFTTGGWHLYNSAFEPLNYFGLTTPIFNGTPLTPVPNTPIFYLDPPQIRLGMVFTVGVPMLLAIALGTNVQTLLAGWANFIGKPRSVKERPSWLTVLLIYILLTTGLLSVLALFSGHVSLPWAIGWSLWGFVTFVCALATWRWAKWGARGLLVCAVLLVMGGFLYDAFDVLRALDEGKLPPLFQMITIPLHPGGLTDNDLLTRLLTIVAPAPMLWLGWLVVALFGVRAIFQKKQYGYPVVTLVLALLMFAFYLASLPARPDTVELVAPFDTGGFTLLGIFTAPVFALFIQTAFFWGIWAVGLGVSVWGVLRGQLWGGMGLVLLLVGWLLVVLFASVSGSMAVLAASHAALVAFALRPVWDWLEEERWSLSWWRATQARMPDTPTGEIPLVVPPSEPRPAQPQPAPKRDTEPMVTHANPANQLDMKTARIVDEVDTEDTTASLDVHEVRKAMEQDAPGLVTEMDAASRYLPDYEPDEAASEPRTKPLNAVTDFVDDGKTQLKPNLPTSIKLDTSALNKSRIAPKSPEQDDEAPEKSATEVKPMFQIKLDTSALKPRTEPKPNVDDAMSLKPPASKLPSIKLDTSHLRHTDAKPKPEDKPEEDEEEDK